MTYDELLDLLAEQFSCDTADLADDTEFAELGIDHEDLIELAWALGEELDRELSEETLAACFTVGDLWRLVQDLQEDI